MPTLKELLSTAPDSQLDAQMIPLVQRWSEPPTALQILEVLDHCIHGGLASGVIVTLLQCSLEEAIKREGTTREAVFALAMWRPEADRR